MAYEAYVPKAKESSPPPWRGPEPASSLKGSGAHLLLEGPWEPKLTLSGAWALGTRASAVVACGLSSCISWALDLRLNSCGTRVELLCGVWDLPGPGIEPMSLALAGGFFTTEPPWRPWFVIFDSSRRERKALWATGYTKGAAIPLPTHCTRGLSRALTPPSAPVSSAPHPELLSPTLRKKALDFMRFESKNSGIFTDLSLNPGVITYLG